MSTLLAPPRVSPKPQSSAEAWVDFVQTQIDFRFGEYGRTEVTALVPTSRAKPLVKHFRTSDWSAQLTPPQAESSDPREKLTLWRNVETYAAPDHLLTQRDAVIHRLVQFCDDTFGTEAGEKGVFRFPGDITNVWVVHSALKWLREQGFRCQVLQTKKFSLTEVLIRQWQQGNCFQVQIEDTRLPNHAGINNRPVRPVAELLPSDGLEAETWVKRAGRVLVPVIQNRFGERGDAKFVIQLPHEVDKAHTVQHECLRAAFRAAGWKAEFANIGPQPDDFRLKVDDARQLPGRALVLSSPPLNWLGVTASAAEQHGQLLALFDREATTPSVPVHMAGKRFFDYLLPLPKVVTLERVVLRAMAQWNHSNNLDGKTANIDLANFDTKQNAWVVSLRLPKPRPDRRA